MLALYIYSGADRQVAILFIILFALFYPASDVCLGQKADSPFLFARETAGKDSSIVQQVMDNNLARPDSSLCPDTSLPALHRVKADSSATIEDSTLSPATSPLSTQPAPLEQVQDTLSAEKKPAAPDSTSRKKKKTADLLPDSLSGTAPPQPEACNPRALRYNGIYLSSGTAARNSRITELIKLCKGTVISGFVVDMKDDNGYLAYTSKMPLAADIGSNTRRMRDPAQFVRQLHENGLVASARVVCFKDPNLASYAVDGTYPYAVLDSVTGQPWKQGNGEKWANPYDVRVHDYLLGVIGELVSFGFDQIQLDYVRFPTDGVLHTISYPLVIDSLSKIEVIGSLLSRVRKILDQKNISLAVDVFGWVPWLRKGREFQIGQDYDMIAQYADVICPMLYSSHFPNSFKAEYGHERAYHIVREGTAKGFARKGSLPTGVQPYIQGFKWHAPHFGTEYLIGQMRAAEESGAIGWIVWNAGNDYSALWKALGKSGKEGQIGME